MNLIVNIYRNDKGGDAVIPPAGSAPAPRLRVLLQSGVSGAKFKS